MRLIAIIGITILLIYMLAGCSTISPLMPAVEAKIKGAADAVLAEGERLTCDLGTWGALNRRYFNSISECKRFVAFCNPDGIFQCREPSK